MEKLKHLGRNEKIKFLNDFKNGEATVNSIIRVHADFWNKTEKGATNMKTNEFLSQKEFGIICQMAADKNNYLVVVDKGTIKTYGKLHSQSKFDEETVVFFVDVMRTHLNKSFLLNTAP